MKAIARRKLEMGKRALDFSRAHPESTPGYTAALTRLEALLTRADELATQQRDGISASRAATSRKRDLRRAMTLGHLNHLTRVARVAATEAPDLPQKFLLRGASTYFAFRTAARSMAAEAAANKEVLEKHGLSETVLGGLTQALDQFDAAMDQSASSRQAHVGASAELDAVASEVVQVVTVMDGLNRARFGKDSDSLAAWESARNVVATPHPAVEPAAPAPAPAPEQVKPAA